MTQRWNPNNLQDIAQRLVSDPSGTGRDLDQTVQIMNRQLNAIPTWTIGEVPRGVINGTNTIYALKAAPSGGIAVYADGLRTSDFRLSGATLALGTPPATSLIVDYQV